jgi:polyisoprenyl-phosphate glycosyltransferase
MAPRRPASVTYSIVVPVFNERAVLPILLKRPDALAHGLGAPPEAIFVDVSGSRAR